MIGHDSAFDSRVNRAGARRAGPPRITGDWQARIPGGEGDDIRHVMVRSDSSAQFGHDLARWRTW